METLFLFLAKSSGLISLFYLSYVILLRKETFFNSNRWFLLAGLISSVVLPLIVFTKIVWVESTPTNFDWSNIPITTNVVENEAFEINWYLIFVLVYSIGIVGFLLKFALDFYSLTKVLKGKTIQRQADFKFIDVTENIAPFSYFNFIVYNSSLYTKTELENILEHEKVHSTQNHTADVLISRLFCVLFWFNPLMWLYKKAIIQNLEFIADSKASKNISDKKGYQLTLLKITTQENCVAITNHFYQSLIKKRIVMLNKNQSNKRNSWKYAVVLPLLVAFAFFFQVEVVAQEKESVKIEIKSPEIDKTNLIITKNTTNKEIKEHCEQIKKRYNIDLTFFNIKRNSKGEIINIESKYENKNDGGSGSSSQLDLNNTPIKPFKFLYNETKKETGYINMDLTSLYKGKEIIINGKVVSQDELAKLNPNEIKSIAENTKNGKPSIEIDTKNAFKPVKITDKDIYINGVKVTNEEFNKLDQSTVDKVDVNTFENTVRITTKTIKEEKPVIIVDGSIMNSDFNIETIDPNKIESINVRKGKNSGILENGIYKSVIEVATKNYVPNPINYEKALIIIDGKESDYKTLLKIKDKEVKFVYTNPFDNKKWMLNKYGDKARNGVMEAVTSEKKSKNDFEPIESKQDKVVNGWMVSSKPVSHSQKEILGEIDNVNQTKAVIVIDGKISNFRKMNKLNPKQIVSITVQKISDGTSKFKDDMVAKYGEKALNGIIEVETKKF